MEALGRHLIIGSDGAAFATVRAAQERGYEAAVLVPRGAPSVRLMPSDIIAHDFDPDDTATLRRHMADVATVYYCCGSATLPIDEAEPERLARLIQVAAKAKARLVYCDAPYAYGSVGRPLSEDLPQRARDPMGVFLAALAEYVLHAHRSGKIEAVLARHAELIGPDVVRSHFGTSFVQSVLHKRPLTVLGRVDIPRSLTYAPDLGRALVFLGEQRSTWGQLWHVPSVQAISPEKLVNALRENIGLGPLARGGIHEVRSTSGLMSLLGGGRKAQQRLARVYEAPFMLLSSKFERAFGLHATGFSEIVEETVRAVKCA